MNIENLRSAINGLFQGLRNFIDENKVREKYNEALSYCKKEGKENKVRLIKGDLSGIQPFIYNVKRADDVGGKVAKQLRGRSFYISAICHAVAEELRLKINQCFNINLSEQCKLMVSGGKFLLLVPDLRKIKKKFTDFSREIDEWLWAKFWGAIYMNLVISKPLTEEDLNKRYVVIARKLQNELEKNKLNKFNSLLKNSKKLLLSKSKKENYFKSHVFNYDYNRECHSCGQLPAIIKIKPEDEHPSLCIECFENQTTGEYPNLPTHNRVCFRDSQPSDPDIHVIRFHKLYGILRETYDLQYKSLPRIPAYVRQYDVNTKVQDLWVKCPLYQKEQRVPDECQNEKDLRATKFHCLAADAKGAKKIGVLAGDMGNLGIITNSVPLLTLLDVMLLSQALYTFFCDYLIDGLLKDRPFYIVYSGGDDFLVVGSWHEVVKLAGEIREALHEFSKGVLSFSAGLIVTNPQDPIYESADLARKLLQEAKDHGRNRIKAMGVETGTVIDWERYSDLFEWAKWLQGEVRTEKNPTGAITIGFLYNLYPIYKLYQRWRKEEDTEGLRYLSLLTSHLKRNLDESIPKQKEILQFFQRNLMDIDDKKVLPYFRFILDYVALSQRT